MSNTGLVTRASIAPRQHLPLSRWNIPDADPEHRRDSFPSGRGVHARYEGLLALSEQRRTWPVEATQLRPGRFVATDFSIQVGSMLVNKLTCNLPVTLRIAPPLGCVSIVLPGSPEASFSLQGRTVSDQCVLMRGTAELELACAAHLDAVTICLSEDAWYSLRGKAEVSGESRCKRAQVIDPGAPWTQRVRATTDELRAAVTQSTLLASPCAVLSDCLRELPEALLASDEPCSGNRRALAVERARRFIERNLAAPLRVATVCAATGAQARTLEYGFREILGLSPISYIKALRLNRVHRLLLSPAATRRTITEVALDCGFWHLSQFASDYQKFFGESPSVSRRRAQLSA